MELFKTVYSWLCFQNKAMDQSVSIVSQIAASGIYQWPLGSKHNPQQGNNPHPPSHLKPPSGCCVNHAFCTSPQCVTVKQGTFPIYSPSFSTDQSWGQLCHFEFGLHHQNKRPLVGMLHQDFNKYSKCTPAPSGCRQGAVYKHIHMPKKQNVQTHFWIISRDKRAS